MRKILGVLLFCVGFNAAQAQLIRQAPWQQRVDYTIHVQLDDIKHVLHGFEDLLYYNNSPDTLKEIFFHLWPNAYLNNETPFAKQQVENGNMDFYYAKDEQRGRMDSLNFKANGEKVKTSFVNGYEIIKLSLNKPLNPGEQLTITTSFRVKIPEVFSRLGHNGQQYCITQWYPKPAVYDVNGWNPMPYLDQGEFYSEFGRFEVNITLPENYLVAATGNLQNEDEWNKILALSNKKFEKDPACNAQFPTSSLNTKTLRFVQDSVHDFAWFADKRFQIERNEVQLDNGHKVMTWVYQVCPKESVVHWVDSAVQFYSKNVGNYPYAHATVVVTPLKAGGGMEYPTITNITEVSRQVIVHELGHNWFYGILGSNERSYPWMDESINTYYEARSTYKPLFTKHPGLANLKKTKSFSIEQLTESSFGLLELQYLVSARNRTDQPSLLNSEAFTSLNYGTIIYSKASLAFLQLQQHLGTERFDALMKSYYERWKFKHPLPGDFMDHAKTFTGEDLSWFFDDLMGSSKIPDVAICKVQKSGDSVHVKLKNKGGVLAPVYVQAFADSSLVAEQKLAGFKKEQSISFYGKNISNIRIDALEQSLDVYRGNNYARTKGLSKTYMPLEFSPVVNLEKPNKTQIFYSPIIGANMYNKTMLGVAFYNSLLPRKNTEFWVAPMFAFGTKDLTGTFSLQHRFFPHAYFREIQVGIEGARFALQGDIAKDFFDSNGVYTGSGIDLDNRLKSYEKVAPRLTFIFNQKQPRTEAKKQLDIRYVLVQENRFTRALLSNFDKAFAYTDIRFTSTQKRKLNPTSWSVHYQYGQAQSSFQKIWAEYNTVIDYGEKNKGLNVRVFGGTFLTKPESGKDERVLFRLAENNGYYDYLYDESQFGRGNVSNIFTQQIMPGTSGFRAYAQSLAATDSWLLTANFTSSIPGILPIRVFVDAAAVNGKTTQTNANTGTSVTIYEATIYYVTGLSIWAIDDVFQVNFPLFADQLTTNNWDIFHNSYLQRITFTLRLNNLNPIKLARSIGN